MSHARIKPSKAGQWIHCPGSIVMQEQFPEVSGEAANEGNAVHWMAAEVLCGRGADPFMGRTAPNGIVINEEMVDAAKVYVGAVRNSTPPAVRLVVEEQVACHKINPGCWGTPDCWYFDPLARLLTVWDLKYGYGIVEPYENWQLMTYAAGIVAKLADDHGVPYGRFDQSLAVKLVIVQPRAFHSAGVVRSWLMPEASHLRGYINRLSLAATEAIGPSPTCKSGDHCNYCSARHACPTAQRASMFALDYIGQSVPEMLSPEALAIELTTLLRASNAIKYRLTALEAQAAATIRKGQLIPGFGLENGSGRLNWNCSPADIIAMGDLLGVNLRKDLDAITPAQAVKAGMQKELIDAYASRTPGELKLVRQDNTAAARVFGLPANQGGTL